MIIRVLLFLTLAPFASTGQTAVYHPFPDSNVVWSVNLIKYFIHGDSVVNSTTYKKYYYSPDSNLTPATWHLAGLVRQDTAHHRILGIRNHTTAELPLYDFNLNVSDSLTVYPLDSTYVPNRMTLSVLLKDSVRINGLYRKRLEMKPYSYSSQQEYWIEGIGSMSGPLNPGLCAWNVTDNCMPVLLCEKQQGILFYLNPQYNACYFNTCLTGIAEHPLTNLISVFPNPASVSFHFQIRQEIPGSVELYNLLGQRVAAETFQSGDFTMDVSARPKGIYFYRITAGHTFSGTGKLVIE